MRSGATKTNQNTHTHKKEIVDLLLLFTFVTLAQPEQQQQTTTTTFETKFRQTKRKIHPTKQQQTTTTTTMSQPYVAAFGGADSMSAFFQPTAKRPRFDGVVGAGGSTAGAAATNATTTGTNGGVAAAATNPFIGDILDPSSFFDDAFPLSNSSGGGHGGGHGNGGASHALRTLSNPWLLSQMRRASLSAFMDTAAMSNMMLPGSSTNTSTNNFYNNSSNNNNSSKASNGSHTLIVPSLDGPADRDEIFKTGDNVIFGAGATSNNTMNNNIGGGGTEARADSSSSNDPNNHNLWGMEDPHHSKDPNANIQTLASLQFQHQQLQLQQQQNQQQQQLNQQQMYAIANNSSGNSSSNNNKRSATSARLDAHKSFQQYITSHVGAPSAAGATPPHASSGPASTIVSPSSSVSSSLNNGQRNVSVGVSAVDVGVAGGGGDAATAAALNVRFRSHQAENWTEKYEALLDYRLKNGHCLVPNQYAENPPLAEWVKRQRYQYKLKQQGKHSSMSDDRIAALEKLGFVWNSHDEVWEERLNELKQYKSIFGDTNVPSNYQPNPKLAIWVKRQRRQRKFLLEGKKSTMTTYRCHRLEEIGFTWSGRKPKKAAKTETWEKKNAV